MRNNTGRSPVAAEMKGGGHVTVNRGSALAKGNAFDVQQVETRAEAGYTHPLAKEMSVALIDVEPPLTAIGHPKDGVNIACQ